MRFLQSLGNLEDQEHLYHDNVLAERFRIDVPRFHRMLEIQTSSTYSKYWICEYKSIFYQQRRYLARIVLMILDLRIVFWQLRHLRFVRHFTLIVIVDESIDSKIHKDRCSCNSKEYAIWVHNEFIKATRNLRIDLWILFAWIVTKGRWSRWCHTAFRVFDAWGIRLGNAYFIFEM